MVAVLGKRGGEELEDSKVVAGDASLDNAAAAIAAREASVISLNTNISTWSGEQNGWSLG